MPLNFSKSHKQTHPFAHNPPKNTLLPQNLLKITRLPQNTFKISKYP